MRLDDELWLWRRDGEPQWSVLAMSLLCGKSPEQINPHAPIPDEWLKDMRRRSYEAQAATDRGELVDVLRYWTRADLGMEIIDLGDEIRLFPPPTNL